MYINQKALNEILTSIYNQESSLMYAHVDNIDRIYTDMRSDWFELVDLYDHQRSVFDEIMSILEVAFKDDKKHTIIVDSMNGSGKSVLACALVVYNNLVDSCLICNNPSILDNIHMMYPINEKINPHSYKKTIIDPDFLYKIDASTYKLMIIDDAHLLKNPLQKGHLRRNYISKIFKLSKVNVFFLNTLEEMKPFDELALAEILKQAKLHNSIIHRGSKQELKEPCRCNLDYVLFVKQLLGLQYQQEQKLNLNFDFRVYDNPTKMRQDIITLERSGVKSEIVTCYPYHYKSHKDFLKNPHIITLKNDFKVHINDTSLADYKYDYEKHQKKVSLYTSVKDHELHYIGVIIGKELAFKEDTIEIDLVIPFIFSKWHRYLVERFDLTIVEQYVMSIYYQLLTKSHSGCFVYCEDKKLREHFHKLVSYHQDKKPSL